MTLTSGASFTCGSIEDVEIEKSDKSCGAGALKAFPFGSVQLGTPLDPSPQHCYREVIGLYTTSVCQYSPKL